MSQRPPARRSRTAGAAPIDRLHQIRSTRDAAARREKVELLHAIDQLQPRDPRRVATLHDTLCFLRAFPDSSDIAALTEHQLADFGQRLRTLSAAQRRRLDDSAIEGSIVREVYSWAAARWLAANCPGQVEIDWPNGANASDLDPVLRLLLGPSEQDGFEEAGTARQWLRRARGNADGTDFDWLLCALEECGHAPEVIEALYDAAELPLRWKLKSGCHSRTRNTLPGTRTVVRRAFRRPGADPRRAIFRPLTGIRRVAVTRGQTLIDVAQAALLTRRREVYALNHANPHDVHVADLGRGAQVAIFGVRPAARLTLEANYGYVMFAGGAPVGYGGVSALFHQANTGVNVFPEYRHTEAAFMFTRTLRAFHTLFGCRRFIVNPYQFGQGNQEAIGSAAFWFYYRLGFRPADPTVAALATRTFRRIRTRPGTRTPADTLRQLARCDLQLDAPKASDSLFVEEAILHRCSLAATGRIATAGNGNRALGLRRIHRQVQSLLDVRPAKWKPAERQAFNQLCPVVGLLDDLPHWPRSDRNRLASLLRAKGGVTEISFVRAAQRHARLREALCTTAEQIAQ